MSDAQIAKNVGQPWSVVIAAHGSSTNRKNALVAISIAESLNGTFPTELADVHIAFWKEERALRAVLRDCCSSRILVLPLLMADGYFGGRVFPRELRMSLPNRAQVFLHRALGEDEEYDTLASQWVEAQSRPRDTLIVCAHGTERARGSRARAESLAASLARRTASPTVKLAFLDESPTLDEVLTAQPPGSSCAIIPAFAATGMHVEEDIPAITATHEERLSISVLPALGPALFTTLASDAVCKALEGRDLPGRWLTEPPGGGEEQAHASADRTRARAKEAWQRLSTLIDDQQAPLPLGPLSLDKCERHYELRTLEDAPRGEDELATLTTVGEVAAWLRALPEAPHNPPTLRYQRGGWRLPMPTFAAAQSSLRLLLPGFVEDAFGPDVAPWDARHLTDIMQSRSGDAPDRTTMERLLAEGHEPVCAHCTKRPGIDRFTANRHHSAPACSSPCERLVEEVLQTLKHEPNPD